MVNFNKWLSSNRGRHTLFALTIFSLFFSRRLFAAPNLANYDQNNFFSPENSYQPYLEVGGAKYFNQSSTAAGIYDLFIPLLQKDDRLLFTDLRLYDRSGSQSEGNFHLGYRKLYPEIERMVGIYGAFDLKRTINKNSLSQLTLGFEFWQNRFFIGGNIYYPINKTKKYIPEYNIAISKKTDWTNREKKTKTVINQYAEKALPGIDTELGHAITDNLTSYIGGYYFAASNVPTIIGPKIRVSYDYMKPTGRILGVLDGVSIEMGAQYDKPRRKSAYISIKLKVGMTGFEHNSNVKGFARHMVELVRRDQDIVYQKTEVPEKPQTITTVDKLSKKDFIDHFKITRETLAKDLFEIPLMLISDNNSDAAITYLHWIYEIIAETHSDIVNGYYTAIKNGSTRWSTKPIAEKFIDLEAVDPIQQELILADHLANLGITNETSPQEIKKIRRELLCANHPDKNGDGSYKYYYLYNQYFDKNYAKKTEHLDQQQKWGNSDVDHPKLLMLPYSHEESQKPIFSKNPDTPSTALSLASKSQNRIEQDFAFSTGTDINAVNLANSLKSNNKITFNLANIMPLQPFAAFRSEAEFNNKKPVLPAELVCWANDTVLYSNSNNVFNSNKTNGQINSDKKQNKCHHYNADKYLLIIVDYTVKEAVGAWCKCFTNSEPICSVISRETGKLSKSVVKKTIPVNISAINSEIGEISKNGWIHYIKDSTFIKEILLYTPYYVIFSDNKLGLYSNLLANLLHQKNSKGWLIKTLTPTTAQTFNQLTLNFEHNKLQQIISTAIHYSIYNFLVITTNTVLKYDDTHAMQRKYSVPLYLSYHLAAECGVNLKFKDYITKLIEDYVLSPIKYISNKPGFKIFQPALKIIITWTTIPAASIGAIIYYYYWHYLHPTKLPRPVPSSSPSIM